MIDPFFGALDVAVQHGAVGLQSGSMDDTRDLEPALAIGLVIADLLPDPWCEDLGAAAGTRIEPRTLEPFHDLFHRDSRKRCEEIELDHGQGLEVDPRETDFERPEQVFVVVHLELGMEPADDVKLGHALVHIAGGDFHRLLDRVGPAAISLPPRDVEGAQAARRHADVCGIEVSVEVVIGPVFVEVFAHQIGEPTDAEQVGGGRDDDAVVTIQSMAVEDFRRHRSQPIITKSELIHRAG